MRVSVSMPANVKKSLAKWAKREGLTMSAFAAKIIENHIYRKG